MAAPLREVEFEVLPKNQPPPPGRPVAGGKIDDPLIAFISRIMDSLITVPGTNIKIGLDPIIGLIPGVGSGASALVSLLLIVRSASHGVPNHILARMAANVLLNAVLDGVPVIGDALSIFFRSNDRNYELLQRHAGTRHKPGTKEWLLLGAMFLGVIAVVVFLFIGFFTVLGHAFHALTGG